MAARTQLFAALLALLLHAAPAHPQAAFDVLIVGSGSPQYSAERSRPSALIRHGATRILVDMGIGTERRLQEARIPLGTLQALLFTHHHIDHDAEFASILVQSRVRGAGRFIAGPPGTAEYAEFLLKFYAEDMRYRAARTGQTLEALQRGTTRDLQGGESFEIGTLKVSTARVEHAIHTVAYRFNAAEGSIVISGDLVRSENLVALARDADVLVIDASAPPGIGAGRVKGKGKGGGDDALRGHATAEEIADMASKARVKTLVLTHFGAAPIGEAALTARVSRGYTGRIVVAKDLLAVSP